MNPVYLSRAYNYGARNDWKGFMTEMYEMAERGRVHPDNGDALLDKFIAGKANAKDAGLSSYAHFTTTTPHMRRKMSAMLDVALREAAFNRHK